MFDVAGSETRHVGLTYIHQDSAHLFRRDSSARRVSQLRHPEDFEQVELQIHQAQNDDIIKRRLKHYRESWVGLDDGNDGEGEEMTVDNVDYFGGDEMASGSEDEFDE